MGDSPAPAGEGRCTRYAAVGTLALAGALAVRPMTAAGQSSWGAFATFTVLCTGAAFLIVDRVVTGAAPRLARVVTWPLALFWYCALLGGTLSIQQMHSARALLDLLAWTTVLLATAYAARSARLRAVVVGALVAASVVFACHALAQRLFLFDLLRASPEAEALDPFRLGSNRVYGPFLSPGIYGSYLALMIPWQLGLADGTAGRRKRTAMLLLVGLQVVVLVLTRSRTAWIATGVALLLYARMTRPGRMRGIYLLPLASAAGLLLAWAPDLLSLDTLRVRVSYWQGTLGMLRLRPLLGVGLGAWSDAYPTAFVPGGSATQVAHNDWLQRLAETGYVGGIAFALVACGTLYLGARGWRHAADDRQRRRAAGVWCGIVAVFVSACFDYPFQMPSTAWVIAAAMGLVLCDAAASSRGVPARRWGALRAGSAGAVLCGAVILGYCFERGDSAWAAATAAADRGDADACEAACREVMVWAPLDPDPYALVATIYLQYGARIPEPAPAYEVAATAATGAVVRAPWNPWHADHAGIAHWRLADAYADEAMRAGALQYFRRAATHFPAHPGFQNRLAGVLGAVGNPDASAALARAQRTQAAWVDTPDISGPSRLGADIDLW